MKNIRTIVVLAFVASLAACSGKQKKVVIMSSGKFKVEDKTIRLDPGYSHNEEEVVYKGDKVTLTVKTTDGTEKTFDMTEDGVYVLNLQNDTLIGGIVNYGSTGMPSSISNEQLDRVIDSTQQLMLGLNANDADKTYFLPPFSIKKITTENNVKIVGSFKGIPYKVEADGSGKVPDVFKFFTNKQKRETLNELIQERIKIKMEGHE